MLAEDFGIVCFLVRSFEPLFGCVIRFFSDLNQSIPPAGSELTYTLGHI